MKRLAAIKGLLAGGAATLGLAATPALAAECGELAALALPAGKVTSAELVEAGKFVPPSSPFGPPPGVGGASPYAKLPAFCRVQATLTPSSDSDIKVEVWLPASGWNGKYVGIGNGIWAGQLSISQLADPLARGYAVATTDTGHTGTGLTADFAIGHPEKLVDFGYRAVHEMTVAAKRAIAAFYGKGPSASYWNSCSTGGRQGLMAAYRYPEDYDAISAMAPANPMTDLMTQSMWAGWQPQRAPGAALSVSQLTAVHQAVVKQCDKLDGLEDGVVGRPDDCKFDPATVEGLSEPQVQTMRAIYRGVIDPDRQWSLAGWPVGSEMQLALLTQGERPFPVAYTYYSMLAFADRPGWDWKSFDFARDAEAGREYGAGILDVPADGLAPFFARGGKLLLSHGWNDGLIPANNSRRFASALSFVLSEVQEQRQFRFYMLPGMDHCGGGEGLSQVDTLGIIDDWATSGRPPERIIATRPTAAAGGPPGAPAGSPRAPMTRPVWPYPATAQYRGGDPNDPNSFEPLVPTPVVLVPAPRFEPPIPPPAPRN